MKSLLHLLLCLLILLNGMVFSVIQGSYELNKAYIIEKLCVNTSIPELNCDGKCFLTQQLNEQQERQEKESKHAFSMDFGQYIIENPPCPLELSPSSWLLTRTIFYPSMETTSFLDEIEIPPKNNI